MLDYEFGRLKVGSVAVPVSLCVEGTAWFQVARLQPWAGKVGPADGFWLRCREEILQNDDESIRETCNLETHLVSRRCLDRIGCLHRIGCPDRIGCSYY